MTRLEAHRAVARLPLLGVLFVLHCGCAAAAEPPLGFRPLALKVTPIERFEFGRDTTRFGELEFRGGLELESRDADFGGFSGLDFDPKTGAMLAVSDTGSWLRARIVEEGGRLTNLRDAAIAPMRNVDGNLVRRKNEGDAEALRIVERDGRSVALVPMEEIDQIRAFAYDLDISLATPLATPFPAGISQFMTRQGVEALAVAPASSPLKGATVLVSEGALPPDGNNRGWILDGPLKGEFAVLHHGQLDVTDAAFLAGGDLILLERSFTMGAGFGTRMRFIAGGDIRPGARLEGRTLMEADMRFQIDNMEGLAVRESADEVEFYLVSDDNHSIFERTLLLKFAWRKVAPTGK